LIIFDSQLHHSIKFHQANHHMTTLLEPDADGVMAPRLHGLVSQSNEAYHSGPGISSTRLHAIAVSPLNYWDQYVNPAREPREYKHCFAVGDGTHKLVLEPGTFEHTYAVGFDKTAYPDALNTADDMKKVLTENGLMISGAKPELARRLVEEAGYPREKIMMFLEEEHRRSIAGKIERNLADRMSVSGHDLFTSPSIGISLMPGDGTDPETLIRNADVAMYHAKTAGRNNHQFFAARMNEASAERLTLENALREALSTSNLISAQFSLHFQPQFHLATGSIISVEALARWNHPTLGSIPPVRFIPLAEETGLIQALGDWVFWESCRQLRAFKDKGLDLRVAVNLSAQQLRHEGLPAVVRGALACFSLDPSDLELEITESTAMQNPELTVRILDQLSDMGIILAIDDFGTGYSSLSYLKHLPIQRLKLDRSFVKDIETDVNDAAICSATVALGHNLGLELVAEGVETETQKEFLARLGCDVLQGYLYSRPLPADQIAEFLLGLGDTR